jgi:hypothetical protein
MVDDTTIGDIKVRAESVDSRLSGHIDTVYVDLRTDHRHHLCISGKPDEVVAVLMAAAGRILQAQEVGS